MYSWDDYSHTLNEQLMFETDCLEGTTIGSCDSIASSCSQKDHLESASSTFEPFLELKRYSSVQISDKDQPQTSCDSRAGSTWCNSKGYQMKEMKGGDESVWNSKKTSNYTSNSSSAVEIRIWPSSDTPCATPCNVQDPEFLSVPGRKKMSKPSRSQAQKAVSKAETKPEGEHIRPPSIYLRYDAAFRALCRVSDKAPPEARTHKFPLLGYQISDDGLQIDFIDSNGELIKGFPDKWWLNLKFMMRHKSLLELSKSKYKANRPSRRARSLAARGVKRRRCIKRRNRTSVALQHGANDQTEMKFMQLLRVFLTTEFELLKIT